MPTPNEEALPSNGVITSSFAFPRVAQCICSTIDYSVPHDWNVLVSRAKPITSGETLLALFKRSQLLLVWVQIEFPPSALHTGTISIAWENASMHEDDEVEAVVPAAAGRLVLLYLPTDSPQK